MNRRFDKAKASGVTPQRRRKPPISPSARSSSATRPPVRSAGPDPARGVGVGAPPLTPRRGTARGTPACSFLGRVRNLGRGVWGFGSIVGWIPAGVCPWWWCRRKGLTQIFRKRTGPLVRARPYVWGDDGRYHLPERWKEV